MAKPDPVLLQIDRYPVCLEVATRFQDLDPNNHINNVALAAIFEEVRVRFDVLLGLSDVAGTTGIRTMIASLEIEFLGEASYPDPVKVHVGTLAIGRTSWTVAAVALQGDSLVSYMRSTVVNVDHNGAVVIPAICREALAKHQIRLGPGAS